MVPSQTLPTWAPRVKAHLIRRLYENDAQGLCDEDLLNEVGWALFSRCESFILAVEASQGRVHCPGCGTVIRHTLQSKEVLHCPSCGWEYPLKTYLKTIQNQQLNGGLEVAGLFQDYVEKFPTAKTQTEKMLLIDMLIHGFHYFIRSGRTRRPVGVNLIDGNLEFVIDFLDRLTCGPESTHGLEQTRTKWREKIKSLRKSKRMKASPK